jgi:acetyl esterase/lipase
MSKFTLALLALLIAPMAAVAQGPVVTETDVIYGLTHGSALTADIAYPSAGQGIPAIVYIHGGRWRGGSKSNNGGLRVAQWADLGFFAMSIDYRLVGGSPAPAPYQDTMTAIRWLHAHADDYGVDPDRIYLIGNSSGGHLVSLVATLGDGPYEKLGGWEDARSDVAAVISVAGPYDLNTLDWGNLWTPVEGDVMEARRIASPMSHVSAATRPILVIHSDDDQSVPIQQALDFVAALDAAGVRHEFRHYTDRGHMSVTDYVIEETLAFIEALEGDEQSSN